MLQVLSRAFLLIGMDQKEDKTIGQEREDSKNSIHNVTLLQKSLESPASPLKNATSCNNTQPAQYMAPQQLSYNSSGTFPSRSNASTQSAFVDPDYTHFITEHAGQAAPQAAYEAKRAVRQMSHYFDVTRYRQHQETTNTNHINHTNNNNNNNSNTATARSQLPSVKKPTKKELEQFKKRKEERKRIRNRWLFE